MNPLDIGPQLETKIITADNDALAAGTGDAGEVTGDDIDMEKYVSGKVVVNYKTSLTADKTLSFGLQKEDSDAEDGSKSTDVVIEAARVVETGVLTAHEGTAEWNISANDLAGWKRWVAFLITPDLSHSGTDTVTWSACFVGVLKKS